MGLMVHSLSNIPDSTNRDYWIYILDYGWKEPLSETLKDNFFKMAEEASANSAVIIRGVGCHFENEVLSWHHINNKSTKNILPAILITNRHPRYFMENSRWHNCNNRIHDDEMNMILIPLNKVCDTPTDVVNLIKSIFSDIYDKTAISKFRIIERIDRRTPGSLADAIIVKPTFMGVGIDLMSLFSYFKKK
ncbi:hypothetical protein WJT86_08290 [Microvirga sp. W0021]|uniref:Uncharacterized protein n=1 Tax=Hohaiivirga grylli TaxID=3133970 RepID=A0ABV0BJ70_9HYPH